MASTPYAVFNNPELAFGGLVVGEWSGTVATLGNPPRGAGSALVLVPTAAITTAGTATVTAINGNGDRILLTWTATELAAGRTAGSAIPPNKIALESASSVALLPADSVARGVVSIVGLTSTLTTSFKIQTPLSSSFTTIQNLDATDKPTFKKKPDSNAYATESGRAQGELMVKVTVIDIAEDQLSFLSGQIKRYGTANGRGISTRPQISVITLGGTLESGDILIAVINGVTVSYTTTTTVLATEATALAAAISAATIPGVATAAATGANITVTSAAGVAFDIAVYSTETAGAVADAQTISYVTTQETQFEYAALATTERPFVKLTMTPKGNQDFIKRPRIYPKALPMAIGAKYKLGDYDLIDIEFDCYVDYTGVAQIAYENN